MDKHNFVSIIITSYNYGEFLKQTIDSALNQSYKNKEVIVVDDGSIDNSPEIIRDYGNEIIAILKENGGQASAFNAGFNVCKGEIIIFLDSDDFLLPDAVQNIVQFFDSPDVAKVHWPLYEVDKSGIRTGALEPQFTLAEGDFKRDMITKGPDNDSSFQPPTSGNAWSRRFLEMVLPMPEAEYKACPDYYLMVLAPAYGKLRSVVQPQSCYRLHGSNYSLKSLDIYMQELVMRFEHTSQILAKHLKNMNIDVDEASWPKSSWFHQLNSALQQIASIVPYGASFILANENHWKGNNIISGCHHIPFTEKDGQYWGAPSDDNAAILEIERQKEKGASLIIFSWTAFWLLDYYKGMHDYLKSNYKCVLNNEQLIAFDLQLHL